MKGFNFSNKKIGMAAVATSVLVIGLLAMPFQGAFANRTALKDAHHDIGRTTQRRGKME